MSTSKRPYFIKKSMFRSYGKMKIFFFFIFENVILTHRFVLALYFIKEKKDSFRCVEPFSPPELRARVCKSCPLLTGIRVSVSQ